VEHAQARLYRPEVDHRMSADLSFEDGRTARVVCGMLSPKLFTSILKVEGETGSLRVLSPFQPHLFHRLTIKKAGVTVHERGPGENSYTLQLRAFIKAIRRGTKLNTDPVDAIGNMRVIDAIYEKAGLKKRGT
jgi:predicted dehydrogenase